MVIKGKIGFQDKTPKISLTVLGTLCFVTLIMCQTRFRITKEISQELCPPVLRSRDYWFLYSIGNPDRFKCVLKAFIVVTSPLLSLISTALLIFGKIESNPYFFLPWLFLTIKGLLFIQTDNIITILKEVGTRQNYNFGFRMEDMKWIMFYGTIFMIDLIEAFSFCEILDLFLVLWNHHPGYNSESATLEAVKKEIADIMDALSKCSLGSLSKISVSSTCESEENVNTIKKLTSRVRFLLKEDDKPLSGEKKSRKSLLKSESASKNNIEVVKSEGQNSLLNSGSEMSPMSEGDSPKKSENGDMSEPFSMDSPKLNLKILSKTDLRDVDKGDCFSSVAFNKEFTTGPV